MPLHGITASELLTSIYSSKAGNRGWLSEENITTGEKRKFGEEMKTCSASSKLDRKTSERNRRMHMKGLCFKLASLIPNRHSSSKDILSQQDRLDHAATYIKQLRERVEEMNVRKQVAMSIKGMSNDIRDGMTSGLKSPLLELREFGASVEVILISGLEKNFVFSEVISVIKEEGAEVVNANFSIVGDKVFHTIHSQVTSPRIGVETSRLHGRLKELFR